MDERDVVELRLRLPAGELGRLAQLMERVRGILAMDGSGAGAAAPAGGPEDMAERGASSAFDPVRFRQLRDAESAAAAVEAGGEAAPVERGGREEIPPALEVSSEMGDLAAADSVGSPVEEAPEAVSAEAEVSAGPDIPAVEAVLSPGPETPAGSTQAVKQAEAVPDKREEASGRELPAPLSVAAAVQRGFEDPERAGAVVETDPPEARGGTFAAVEELVSTGPAPLTAESVALAFQRDDRRYDNGFPLY